MAQSPRRAFALLLVVAGAAATLLAFPSACSSGDGAQNDAPQGGGGPSDAGRDREQAGDAPPDAAEPAPSLTALYWDDAIWTLIKTPGSCNLREGKMVPDPFPKRTWSGCGDGCRVADVAPRFDEPVWVLSGNAAGSYLDGETYLTLAYEAKHGRVARTERLSDGASVAAALDRGAYTDNGCVFAFPGGASPLVFAFFSAGKLMFARVPRAPGAPLAWHDTWLADTPLMRERFVFDDGYGGGTPSAVWLWPTPATVEPQIIDGQAEFVQGYGAQIVWSAGYGSSVGSYTKAGGRVDLIPVAAPLHPLVARLSEDRIVWVTATQDGDLYADATWHWSPRTTDPAAVVAHDGPPIALLGGVRDLQIGGDWAAVNGCKAPNDRDACRVFVWHIGTADAWELPNRPGHRFRRVFAVTPTEIVLGEVVSATDNGQYFDTLVRVDLAALPSLVAAWKRGP